MALDPEKTSKASQTKSRLLELALEKFNEQGFDHTSMRDLAAAADLSLGAFYYHFKSKEDVVQVFYESTLADFTDEARKYFDETKKFEDRFIKTIQYRIKTFQENRELLVALSRAAVDPRSDLSPFGKGQRVIRESMISIFAEMIQGSDLKFNKKLEEHLPMLLWLYLMGIVFFWVYDESPQQKKTFQVINQLSPLIVKLVRFSRLPLSGRVISPVLEVIKTISGKK